MAYPTDIARFPALSEELDAFCSEQRGMLRLLLCRSLTSLAVLLALLILSGG